MPASLITFPRSADIFGGRRQSKWINARLLGTAGTAEDITIPAGATHVFLSATDDFVALMHIAGDGLAAVWPSDKDDGSQPGELSPTVLSIARDGSETLISVVANVANVAITASFYKIDAPAP